MYDDSLKGPIGLLTVLAVRGVAAKTAEKIIGRFSTLRELHEAGPADCKGVLNATLAGHFRDPEVLAGARDAAMREIDGAAALGARIVTAHDEEYPARLAGVIERPLLLTVAGNLPASGRMIGTVGTRSPSPFGEALARRFTAQFADSGWNPVARLTRGIDTLVHETAMLHDVPSVCVLASGLDMFPSDRQRDLAVRIIEAGGAVVTEYALGREQEQGSIIRSNRLVSGLSLATFVMQAGRDDDTLQAARYAVLHERPVYAPVPPQAYAGEPESEGLRILTHGTGVDLVDAIGAKGSFVETVSRLHADTPVATAFRGRDDYPVIMESLEEALALEMPAETLAYA